MDKVDISKIEKVYLGSVQELYSIPGNEDCLISKTTDGGSVFDVGTIFNIKGSDVSRACLRHKIFSSLNDKNCWEALKKSLFLSNDNEGYFKDKRFVDLVERFSVEGAKTHHLGIIDKNTGNVIVDRFPEELSNLTLISKFVVEKPIRECVLIWNYYDYSKYSKIQKYVVPLEYIVRFGITSGSSVLRKYDALSGEYKNKYANELGGFDSIYPWQKFINPIVDFTTKYEPEDRNINVQEAALISGLDGVMFSTSIMMSILGSMMVSNIFNEMGLYLWDLKWEIGKYGDDLYFVDTIDTDSVRITVDIEVDGRQYYVHFNKQSMRDYYKIMHDDWYKDVLSAKDYAQSSVRSFVDVLREGQVIGKYSPDPTIDEEFMNIQEMKMNMISKYIYGEIIDFKQEAKKIAGLEVQYYLSKNIKEKYQLLNSSIK